MGRFGWIVPLGWIALLTVGGCDGAGRDSPASSVGSPAEHTLFLAGDGELTVVDVDAGRAEIRPLPELAPGDPQYRIVRRGDALVLWGRTGAFTGDTYVLDPDLRSLPRKLADSWFFIPSAEPDRVWVAVRRPLSPMAGYGHATLREVAIDGRVTSADIRLPGGRYPQAAVGEELVFWDGRRGLELWSPATGEFTRRLPEAALGPSRGDLLAWCEHDGRTLHVLDVGSGHDRTVALPQGFVAFDCCRGAFSPDGTALAIPARAGGYEADRSLALVDLASGVAGTVAGSTVHADCYVFVAWSSGGERVFMSGGPDDDRRLLQYRLGEPRAARLSVEVRDFYGMAAR